MVGVEFVHVVSKDEQEQGAKLISGALAVAFALVGVYFAVVFWKVTLVVIGVAVLIGVVSMLTSRR